MNRERPHIQFAAVSKHFEYAHHDAPVVALDNVTFAVLRNSFVFLTGPSGAGKSTLVRMLYGEYMPTRGEVLVCGRNIGRIPRGQIPMLRREVGVVHQEFHLIPRKTAFENVLLPLRFAGVGRKEARARAEEALDEVGLLERRHHPAVELAGGEKQRVTLARALVLRPQLIVADEPTGNLDAALADEVFGILERYHSRGNSVFVATHDLARIERSGKPALYFSSGRLVALRGDIEGLTQ